ncbi:MAG: hypothetical protein AB1679_05985 [Actinomycetota bacterium]
MKRTNRCRRDRLYRLAGAAALAVTLGVGPFAGSVPTAGAMPDDEKTWVGDVEKHGRHYDYIGRSCPIEQTEPCPDYIVRYEIVPTSPQAARALPKVAGHRARMIGHKEAVRKPGHNGMLMVSEVQSKQAPRGPLEREP